MSKKSDTSRALEAIIGTIGRLFTDINLSKTINIFDIQENSLSLNINGKYNLHGIKLESESNKFNEYLGFESMVNKIKFQQESRVFIYVLKREDFQAVYVFSFCKAAISQIAEDFALDMLKGTELIDALYDMYFVSKKKIKDNTLIDTSEENKVLHKIDHMYKAFPRRISLASSNIFQKYHIYQGYEYNMTYDFNPVELFKLSWTGLFAVMLNFNHKAASGALKTHKSVAQFGDAETYKKNDELGLTENTDSLDFLENNCCIANSMLILDKESQLSQISTTLGISFDPNYQTSSQIIPKTLMTSREGSFDALVEHSLAKKFFVSSHKKVSRSASRKRGGIPDFYGTDINKNFVNHTLSDNNNPHCVIIGESGVGKSVAVLKILTCLTNLKLSNSTASYLQNGEVNIRYCDVGYTGGRVAKKLKEISPDNVELLKSSVNDFRFSLFDYKLNKFGRADEEDVDFTVQFINTMLEVSSADSKDSLALTNLEEEKLKSAIEHIVENGIRTNRSMEELQTMGFADIVEEIIASDKYTLMSTIDDLTEEKYDFFKIPVLKDLSDYLLDKTNDSRQTASQKQIYETLHTKVESMKTFSCFSTYSNIDFRESKNLFYIDFNSIKDNKKLFTAIFWMLYRRWYDSDKENAMKYIDKDEFPIPTYYFIEEAHNFLNIPSFKKLFDVAVREARKFHIHFIFITQAIDDLPKVMYDAIATKLIVFPFAKRNVIKAQVKKTNADVMYPDEERVFDNITKHMCYMQHNTGSTGIAFKISSEEDALFKPLKVA